MFRGAGVEAENRPCELLSEDPILEKHLQDLILGVSIDFRPEALIPLHESLYQLHVFKFNHLRRPLSHNVLRLLNLQILLYEIGPLVATSSRGHLGCRGCTIQNYVCHRLVDNRQESLDLLDWPDRLLSRVVVFAADAHLEFLLSFHKVQGDRGPWLRLVSLLVRAEQTFLRGVFRLGLWLLSFLVQGRRRTAVSASSARLLAIYRLDVFLGSQVIVGGCLFHIN